MSNIVKIGFNYLVRLMNVSRTKTKELCESAKHLQLNPDFMRKIETPSKIVLHLCNIYFYFSLWKYL